MTEWNIVLVLAELIGLFRLLGKPSLTLNKTLTKFNTELKNMGQRVRKQENSKSEAHNKLWEHNDEQDAMIEDHEIHIRVMEPIGG